MAKSTKRSMNDPLFIRMKYQHSLTTRVRKSNKCQFTFNVLQVAFPITIMTIYCCVQLLNFCSELHAADVMCVVVWKHQHQLVSGTDYGILSWRACISVCQIYARLLVWHIKVHPFVVPSRKSLQLQCTMLPGGIALMQSSKVLQTWTWTIIVDMNEVRFVQPCILS